MSLNILNNLSALYAENGLDKTSSSLASTLQKLSSGSRINSAADDPAGLSLVDGLHVNTQALSQSQANAEEGIGLLQVASGALSQVTSLLNRAVTLAAEASNGTLDAGQQASANQEYQSILGEVTDIGSGTTYNQRQVFNSNTNIYTSDSSTTGASIDNLNIRTLSSSSVGDTGGMMSYTAGGPSDAFINLSTASTNAGLGDVFGSATTKVDVSYVANGSAQSTTISVGAGTAFANTAQGLISAINQAGLGLTASFSTAGVAGNAAVGQAMATNSVTAAAARTETGIEINGGTVVAGQDAGLVSTGGTLFAGGMSSGSTVMVGEQITLQVGAAAAATVTVTPGNDTLAQLAAAIQAANSSVTATVLTNSDGSQSLGLADAAPGLGALSVSTTTASSLPVGYTAGTVGSGPVYGFSNDGAGDLTVLHASAGSDPLTGSITLASGSGTMWTINVDNMGGQPATLNGLAAYINGQNGFTASVTSNAGAAELHIGGATNVNGSQLGDAIGATFATGTLGSFGALTDTLTGGVTIGSLGTANTQGTVQSLINAINDNGTYPGGVKATWVPTSGTAGNVQLTSVTAGAAGNFTLTSAGLTDIVGTGDTGGGGGNGPATATVGEFTTGDSLFGSLTFKNTSTNATTTFQLTSAGANTTLSTLAAAITSNASLGVSAGVADNADGTQSLVFTSLAGGAAGAFSIDTSNLTAVSGNSGAAGSSTLCGGAVANLSYSAASAYSTGVYGDSTFTVWDQTSGQKSNALATFATDINTAGGASTISYIDSVGQSLSSTNLLTQANAEATLTAVNSAIVDVAAQGGFLGAQINTLGAIGDVLSTQQENVTGALNSSSATDFSVATADMSKYQILMQTGVSALAQANTSVQDVTKLLQ
jgi:flagellin